MLIGLIGLGASPRLLCGPPTLSGPSPLGHRVLVSKAAARVPRGRREVADRAKLSGRGVECRVVANESMRQAAGCAGYAARGAECGCGVIRRMRDVGAGRGVARCGNRGIHLDAVLCRVSEWREARGEVLADAESALVRSCARAFMTGAPVLQGRKVNVFNVVDIQDLAGWWRGKARGSRTDEREGRVVDRPIAPAPFAGVPSSARPHTGLFYGARSSRFLRQLLRARRQPATSKSGPKTSTGSRFGTRRARGGQRKPRGYLAPMRLETKTERGRGRGLEGARLEECRTQIDLSSRRSALSHNVALRRRASPERRSRPDA